ncbi:MAG: hypothetical protein HYY99_00260 [Candidatus Colwellbacteria bacterium]|nr:hypothetical protein [Candidatus Colwellbacteria bacterium]
MLVFIASFLLTIIVSLIQATNWLVVDSIIKPDLALAALIVLALINERWPERAFLILTAGLILQFSPDFAISNFIFMGIAALSIILADYLPWQQPISILLAVFIGTVLLNLANLDFLPLAYEITFNLFLTFIFFILLKPIYVQKIELQSSRF